MVVVLVILIFSYRQTIKAYPSAGGAYIVTKDNLGLLPAQVAGVALLTDYILTVAVSVSAGVAALVLGLPGAHPYRVPIALVFIALIACGNLRGVKESGKLFAVPTYFFIVNMFAAARGRRLQGHGRRRPRRTCAAGATRPPSAAGRRRRRPLPACCTPSPRAARP